MITRGNTLLVDTNILLSATDTSRMAHSACIELFALAPKAGVHFVTIGQVFREYLVVATRPIDVNGLGLGPDQAVRNVAAFRTRLRMLPESEEVHSQLIKLVEAHSLRGTRIRDANILAGVQVHHVDVLVSDNVDDYAGLTVVPVVSSVEALDELRRM